MRKICLWTVKSSLGVRVAAHAGDLSRVEGVTSDLVVRPFQFKCIASTVRHFVESALDFHFSMQPVEKVGANLDCDLDGKYNEMSVRIDKAKGKALDLAVQTSLGNVAALSAFVAMTRPPQQFIEPAKKRSVERGERLFRGDGLKLSSEAAGLCAHCHSPILRIDVPVVTIATAEPAKGCPPPEAVGTLGSAGFASSDELPIRRLLQKLEPYFRKKIKGLGAKAEPEAYYQHLKEAIAELGGSDCDAPSLPEGYRIHLTNLGACTGADPQDVPPYVYPRLKPNPNGTIDVPLYSDLKLHDMGEGLSDIEKQETDVMGVFVPRQQFLTRPLWGLEATNPWHHDGRATILEQAILQHESEGSEANPVTRTLRALRAGQQEDIINFLLTLVLSVPEGLEQYNTCPAGGCTLICPTEGCIYELAATP